MEAIQNFNQLSNFVKQKNTRKRIAVACPHDSHTIEAIEKALEEGIASFILYGDSEKIRAYKNIVSSQYVKVIHEEDIDKAAAMAVKAIKDKEADILMKGTLNTDNILKAILNKECGILPKGNVISHVTMVDVPNRNKLIFLSDVAVIPNPTLEQRICMIKYVLKVCRSFGISKPGLALLHFTEKVNPKFPNSTDYVKLKEMAEKGEFGDCILDGPMDIRTAFDIESAKIKGIKSPLNGNADGLIFPNIDAGNIFYKTMTYFCHAEIAGILMGAEAPVVVASRGDSVWSKYCSIAMACMVC